MFINDWVRTGYLGELSFPAVVPASLAQGDGNRHQPFLALDQDRSCLKMWGLLSGTGASSEHRLCVRVCVGWGWLCEGWVGYARLDLR